MKVPLFTIFVFLLKILLINSSKLGGRIISGKLATSGQFPWFASVKMDDSCCCGGTLISSKWVISAAHCLDEVSKAYCYFGSLEQGRGLEVIGKNIVIHPEFEKDENTSIHDVALIELSFRIYFNDTIKLVRLAKNWMTYKYMLNKTMTLAGVGDSRADFAREPGRLRYTQMEVILPQFCELDTMDPPEVRFCTKATDEYFGKSPCHGDSGSGLIYRYKSKNYIIGVVSYGMRECEADANVEEVFHSVQMHLDWIKSTLGVFQYPSLD